MTQNYMNKRSRQLGFVTNRNLSYVLSYRMTLARLILPPNNAWILFKHSLHNAEPSHYYLIIIALFIRSQFYRSGLLAHKCISWKCATCIGVPERLLRFGEKSRVERHALRELKGRIYSIILSVPRTLFISAMESSSTARTYSEETKQRND